MLPVIIVAIVLSGVAVLAEPFAVALQPSNAWLGIDGNWSTVRFLVGSPPQPVNVLASTSISEFWLIDSGGCLPNEPLCNSARGEVFNTNSSKTWIPRGTWNLGTEYLGYPNDNGNYGLELVTMWSPISQKAISLDNVITAAIKSTNFYTGMIGLGIVQGNFDNKIAESPLTQAVKTFGWIPSYSYGYTAGAYYIGESGTPCSVTLGGYDEARFVPHNIDFSLGTNDGLPHALVRHISVSVPEGKEAPAHWGSSTRVLSSMNTSFDALIDSSTPYLWLPDAVCDEFAKAFNLTYNSTFDLYTLSNDQFSTFRKRDSFSFSFSFTSFDNHDDFGHPLQVPGVVNISISAAAFAQVLRYPFQSETIKYGDPAVPYFPLRRAHNKTEFIIGRTFLQEAYLITEYDLGTFSMHQARFPADPIKDAVIVKIDQPDNSPYPPPPKDEGGSSGLSTAQMAGIGAGVVIVALLLVLSLCCYRRRRRGGKKKGTGEEDGKDGASSFAPETPQTPVSRILSKMIRRKRSRQPGTQEVEDGKSQPVEVAADANHEVYELSAPIGPVELDAGQDDASINGDTELGSESTQNLSAYEIARRKMERQLQGPVPAYTPATATGTVDQVQGEKTAQDVSPVATYRPSDHGSPASSPTTYVNSNSLPDSLPSPLTPRGDWMSRVNDLPSPLTFAPPFPSPIFTGSNSGQGTIPPISPNSQTFDPSSISRSNSSNATSPNSITGSLVPPSPIYQRTPIDPSRVICLGPLPENVSLPSPQTASHPSGSDIRSIPGPGMHPEAHQSTDTLGSNFTEVEEQRIVEELTRQASLTQPSHISSMSNPQRELETSRSHERIDAGSELIHVPQLADRRYSWEEER